MNLVFVPGFVSHIDNYWTHPRFRVWLERLGSFARVVMFDKRGTGLSDRVSELPAMDERMDDILAVMDAVGMESAAVFGISEGGSLATMFAAHHPERCDALIVYGGFAKFQHWLDDEELQELFDYADTDWGTGQSLPQFAPSFAEDADLREWWGRFERLGADPGAAMKLMAMNSRIDVSEVLPSIHVPALIVHRRGDTTISFAGAEELAEGIPGARLVELDGVDHIPFVGDNALETVDEIEEFLTGTRTVPEPDRVLATVLFTDIVDSTSAAARMGDERWHHILRAHENVCRQELARHRGTLVKSTGDGILATFDAPARAIKCGLALVERVRELGIEIRAGLHTGEVQMVNGDVEGISVHIAARVVDTAGASEVLVSRTVKDLIAGSAIELAPRGSHHLKGIGDEWQLFLAQPAD